MDWLQRFNADPEKIKWLQNLQDEGHTVQILNDEPMLSVYESLIITCSRMCGNVSEIIDYGRLHCLPDLIEFTDLVLYCTNRMRENATN